MRLFKVSLGSGVAAALMASQWAFAAIPAKSFTLRIIGEPETLDWNKAHTPVENYLMINLMEGLVALDQDVQVQPALAESWKKSKDGKTYTFTIRKDAKWSDGKPVRAQDFVYSWKRLLTPATAASYAYFLFDVENAESFYKGQTKDFGQVGVKAKNDQTLEVTLTQPVAHWIYIPSFWVTFPLREDVVAKNPDSWTKPGNMVTAGPYTLESHQPESKLIMKANPHYYGKRGDVEAITALVVKDDSTALSLFESGKIDFMTDIPSLDLKRLQGTPALRAFPYLKTGYLGFTLNQPGISNVHLRRAIAMAIDKSQIKNLLYGNQQGATSFIPPKMMAHSAKVGLDFDVAKAKAELKASGYDVNQPLKLQMVIPNWEKPLTLSQYIQGELKKNLGLNVSIQPFDHKTFRAQLDQRKFPAFILSWSADYPDPDNFMSLFTSDSGNNRTTWKNKKYDDLIVKARGAEKGRETLYTEAQKILLEDDAVIVPLYYEPQMTLVSKRVKNIELNPINYLYLKKVNLSQ